MLADGYGYIKLRVFSSITDAKVLEALQDIKRRTEKTGGIKGIILDVRHNPGGLLDQGVKVADRFLSSGLIVRTVGKAGKEMDRQMAHSRGTWLGFPMVVLVDGATASAAEIVAGALQDHERAVVLGNPDLRQGIGPDRHDHRRLRAQAVRAQADRLALLHAQRPLHPGPGHHPQHHRRRHRAARGLNDGEMPRERNFDRHLRNEQGEKPVVVKRLSDYQLQVALDYLKSWAVFSKQSVKKG